MQDENKKRKITVDTRVTSLNVTSDGLVILRGGITIDFMSITCISPGGQYTRAMMKFYTDTMDNSIEPVCASCGRKIPSERPVFVMANGEHLYPCSDEQEWVWWTVPGREVKTLQGEE